MATLPDPTLTMLITLLLGTPGNTVGLQTGPLVVDEIPEDRWFSEHWRWDQYEVAAREIFRNPEPWPIQLNAVIACERICTQVLRSRRDPKMLDRLTPMIGMSTREETLAFAELFLHFLTAARPTMAA